MWEVLRVKPDAGTEEQESVSSDGEAEVVETDDSRSNTPATPNPTTYVHTGLPDTVIINPMRGIYRGMLLKSYTLITSHKLTTKISL